MIRTHLNVIGLFLISFTGLAQENNCFRTVNPDEFEVLIDSCTNEIILDVRPTDLLKNKIIPNAVFVPTIDVLNAFIDTVDRDTPVFVYCTVGMRSTKACSILCEKNFKIIVNLDRGIEGWKKDGHPVINIKK